MALGIHKKHPNKLHNNIVQVVFQTAKLGDVNKLKTLLGNRGVNINQRDCSGRTALRWAVENDLPTAVETLIEAGADVNQTRSIHKHLTPVMVAAEKGYTKILQLLTESGAHVNNHRYDKETPLTIALHTGHLTCMEILINAGADCNYLSPGGTPVMLAVRNNNKDCLQVLINNGADVNTPDRGNNTPLTSAVAKSHLDCVNCLLQAGADCNYQSPVGTPVMIAIKNNNIGCLQVLVNNDADFNTPDRWNNTPLTSAVAKSHLDCVNYLLQAGADCNYQSPVGTPVMIAIKNNDRHCLRVLIDNGADVNTSDRWGNTPLTFAIQKDYLACIKTLISGRADLNLRSPKGPPLYTAYSLGKLEVAELLLQGGANVDIANSSGHTLLMLAAIRHEEKWVQTLIQAGANANLVSSTGRTALILAIRGRQTFRERGEIDDFPYQPRSSMYARNKKFGIRWHWWQLNFNDFRECRQYSRSWLLLQHSTKLNIQDNNGKTALMYCVDKNCRHFAELLLDNKADPNIQDNYGKTALMYSVLSNSRDIAELLLDNSADPNVQDTEGKTALMHSLDNNCFDLLLSKNIDIDRSDKTHSTALIYLLRVLVDRAVLYSDTMNRLCILLKCGANPIIHPSHRYLLNKLTNSYHNAPLYRDVLELIRIFVCNGMGSRAKETIPEAGLHCKFLFDKRYRSFLRFAYYYSHVVGTSIMHYLIATCFLTNTDLTLLREGPREYPCVIMPQLLNRAMSQPWPLVKLSFIAVSTAVGFSCDRQERVSKTQLPPRLQRMLMFQEPVSRLPVSEWADIPLCFDPVAYEQLPKPRPLIYYWPFGRDLIV